MGPRNVAVVLYERVELLDFAGPAEVFAAAGPGAFRVTTVAETAAPLRSQGFLTVTPEFTLDDAPAPDIVVIPGGNSELLVARPRLLAWIDAAARRAVVTLTVCTGAFALAALGRLDGRRVTTHWSAIERLRAAAPRAEVVEGARFVDSGDVVTTAGVSAGIDGALHVVARLLGEDAAFAAARHIEYDRGPFTRQGDGRQPCSP
jgi:transcriptional regulator GlxA family with amidase domain